MKKTITVIAAIMLAAVLAVALVACVPSDYTKAEANLKAAGYETAVITAKDAEGLASYALPEGCETSVSGYYDAGTALKFDDDEYVELYYFKDADAAKVFYEKHKADFDKNLEDEKIDLKAELDKGEITKAEYDVEIEALNNAKLGKSGKVVYTGTKAGIKAAQ